MFSVTLVGSARPFAKVFWKDGIGLLIGAIYDVKITEAHDYNVIGAIV